MSMSPAPSIGASVSIVSCTMPAGNISQITLGESSIATSCAAVAAEISTRGLKRLHGRRIDIMHDTIVSTFEQPANHVCAHAPQSDEPELHANSSLHDTLTVR